MAADEFPGRAMQLPAESTPLRTVTEAERQTYAEDGVVLLKQIYPPDWVAFLRAQLNDVFSRYDERQQRSQGIVTGQSDEGAFADMVQALSQARDASPRPLELAVEGDTGAPLSGRSIVETDASHWHAGMRQHNLNGPIAAIAHDLTGSREIVFYSDQLFHKGAGSRVKTPWHQDKPYFLVDGGDVAVCWVPVDRVRRDNGAMGYVRGSHRWGKLFKPSDFATETGTFAESNGISHEGLDTLQHERINSEEVSYFDADPGDVIIHHWATLHGSTGNTSSASPRSAASIRLALDGCYFFQRPSSPEPFRHTLTLESGDPLTDAARFPQIWPR